jgi:hypothetical protein
MFVFILAYYLDNCPLLLVIHACTFISVESPTPFFLQQRKPQGGGGKGSKKGPAKDQSTSADTDSSGQAKVDSATESVAELTVGDS